MRVRSDVIYGLEPRAAASLFFERVPDAAHGLDELVIERVVDLAAQVADVDVDQVRVAEKVAAPHAVEQLVARVDLVAVQQQVLEQRVLFRGEMDLRTAARDLVAVA